MNKASYADHLSHFSVKQKKLESRVNCENLLNVIKANKTLLEGYKSIKNIIVELRTLYPARVKTVSSSSIKGRVTYQKPEFELNNAELDRISRAIRKINQNDALYNEIKRDHSKDDYLSVYKC